MACTVPATITCLSGLRPAADMFCGGATLDCTQEVSKSIEGVHSSNVVAVRIIPGEERVVTGAGDGFVRSITFGGEVQWQAGVGSGGVLCMELQPASSSGSSSSSSSQPGVPAADAGGVGGAGDAASSSGRAPLLAAGSMDGMLSLLDSRTGQLLGSDRAHTK